MRNLTIILLLFAAQTSAAERVLTVTKYTVPPGIERSELYFTEEWMTIDGGSIFRYHTKDGIFVQWANGEIEKISPARKYPIRLTDTTGKIQKSRNNLPGSSKAAQLQRLRKQRAEREAIERERIVMEDAIEKSKASNSIPGALLPK